MYFSSNGTSFSQPSHVQDIENSSKIFQLRSTTLAGTMNGATPRSRVKSWTGCEKKLYNLSLFLSISIIRLCKEGKIDGPHFCKNQVPIIWQKDWIFLKKKKSFAVPQLVFKLCLIVPVISQIFMGQRLKKWSKGDRGRSCLHVGYRVEPCCGVSHLF